MVCNAHRRVGGVTIMKLLILLTVFLNLTSNNAFAGNWNNSAPQDNTKFVTDANYTDFFESKAQYTDFKRWIEKAFKSQPERPVTCS